MKNQLSDLVDLDACFLRIGTRVIALPSSPHYKGFTNAIPRRSPLKTSTPFSMAPYFVNTLRTAIQDTLHLQLPEHWDLDSALQRLVERGK
jgi:hypothetical protein